MRYFEKEKKEATLKYLAELPDTFHTTRIGEIEIAVFPQVFSPKYFHDPGYFAQHVPVIRGEEFLDIGTGTGIMAVFAALRGAKVTAIDINPYALLNAQYNALTNNVKVNVMKSDVFQNVEGRFNTIYSNPPWGCIHEEPSGWIQTALWDKEYQMTSRLVSGAKAHLKENGRLIIGFSSTTGDLDYLLEMLKKEGYKTKIIDRCESKSIDYTATFEILEARMH